MRPTWILVLACGLTACGTQAHSSRCPRTADQQQADLSCYEESPSRTQDDKEEHKPPGNPMRTN